VAKPPIPAPGQLELVRPPAPGRLELVRSFLNTRNVEQGTDALATPAALSAWLRENDLVARKAKLALTPSDVEYVRGIREDVRALTQRNNGADCACLTASLEAASERSRYALVLDPATNTCVLRPTADGVDGALGHILAAVQVAMLDRSWARLKSCADEGCRWTYFDHSKNGCSRWCSAETCGNRSKVKRYRERQAQANV
jgi:predicted RNA-binding Zn ribbon-like protein